MFLNMIEKQTINSFILNKFFNKNLRIKISQII